MNSNDRNNVHLGVDLDAPSNAERCEAALDFQKATAKDYDPDALAACMDRHPAGKSLRPPNADSVRAAWNPAGLTLSFHALGCWQSVRMDAHACQVLRDALTPTDSDDPHYPASQYIADGHICLGGSGE